MASAHWMVDIPGGEFRKAVRHQVMNFIRNECEFFATEDQSEFPTAAAAANTSASTLISKLLEQCSNNDDLLKRYRVNVTVPVATPSSVSVELEQYPEEKGSGDRVDPLAYWNSQTKLPLKANAQRILHTPASSAKIERTFSRSRFFMRPYRSSLKVITLAQLTTLSCNAELLNSDSAIRRFSLQKLRSR